MDQRPLSQREICKHLELFGITEELTLNSSALLDLGLVAPFTLSAVGDQPGVAYCCPCCGAVPGGRSSKVLPGPTQAAPAKVLAWGS